MLFSLVDSMSWIVIECYVSNLLAHIIFMLYADNGP